LGSPPTPTGPSRRPPRPAALGYHVDPKDPRATTLEEADFARLGIHVKELPALARSSGEVVASRTGGGVSLAVGMARIFSGLPGMNALLAYWYHFAIMFEALFILTTIDTGTRIGRFLLQELIGRVHAPLGEPKSLAGGVLSTTAIVVGWAYFILTGNIATLWPMFGVANQLLACTALAIATTILLREADRRIYALVTVLPLVFVATTTISAAVMSITTIYLPLTKDPKTSFHGWVDTGVTTGLLACMVMILGGSALRWVRTLRTAKVSGVAVAT
jgi:carbon starvation protein